MRMHGEGACAMLDPMRTLRGSCILLVLMLGGCDGESPLVTLADGGAGQDAGSTRDAGAPRDAGPRPDAGPVCEGDERRSRLVFYGTREPTAMPLRPGQLLAIGNWSGCTGTFITDQWVLTAAHCRTRVGANFCVGTDPANPNVCFQAAEVRNHPSLDLTLVRMTRPASSLMPELEPIPIMTERLDSSWIGRTAEAAGYGRRQDGTSGIREFTAQPIVAISSQFVVIDGQGMRGVCFGDSGGPVMGLASDSTVRVLGDLSYGDPSCTGRDNYARADVAVEWIESFTGPTPVAGGACGRVTPEGDCTGDMALWCRDGALATELCQGDTRCGWDAAEAGYRCIRGADPCDGLTAVGECRGTVATWCEGGAVRSRDCAPCGEVCGQVPAVGGVYCRPDPCGGVDYLGECRGNVAVWCDNGNLQMRDCGSGAICRYVDDTIGYFCVRR